MEVHVPKEDHVLYNPIVDVSKEDHVLYNPIFEDHLTNNAILHIPLEEYSQTPHPLLHREDNQTIQGQLQM
jgi:DNA-directed RNA polymerase subunit L